MGIVDVAQLTLNHDIRWTERSDSRSGCFNPGESSFITHWVENWVGT